MSLSSDSGGFVDIINVKPEITFFRQTFKRHTNFKKETIVESNSSGSNAFGGKKIFNITQKGDLITRMSLEIELPAVHGNIVTGSTYANWVNSVGYALISSITLKIGSTEIDKHTGIYLDAWNEVSDPTKKEWDMVGKYANKSALKFKQTKKTKYTIPLQFFFNRHEGLGLPVSVIGNEKIKIEVQFNSLSNLVLFDGSNTIDTSITMSSVNLKVDHIFLEADEKNRLLQNSPFEFLIEIIEMKENYSIGNLSNLIFDNCVKEFIWVFRHDSRKSNSNPQICLNKTATKGNDIFNYSGHALTSDDTWDTFTDLQIQVGNTDLFDAPLSSEYFRTYQHMNHHSNVSTKNVYVYSFDLKPEEYQPAGFFNFSRMPSDKTKFQFNGTDSNYKIDIFARKYVYLYVSEGTGSLRDVTIVSDYT
jgi:hypothetical protein